MNLAVLNLSQQMNVKEQFLVHQKLNENLKQRLSRTGKMAAELFPENLEVVKSSSLAKTALSDLIAVVLAMENCSREYGAAFAVLKTLFPLKIFENLTRNFQNLIISSLDLLGLFHTATSWNIIVRSGV